MNSTTYHPWLHRIAIATALVALLPIVVGALVTTLNAGMAFYDWPSSDGYGMFSYPWLKSTGDKFIEHGHRLAGIVIGLMSMLLAATVWRVERRRWVRWMGTLVLLGVIVQGLIGGGRVRLDARILAMFHGSFAAVVLALMAVVVMVTGRTWLTQSRQIRRRSMDGLKPLAVLTCAAIALQYLLGGAIRHLHTALHEHLAGALLVTFFVLATLVTAFRSKEPWLIRSASALTLLLIVQGALGAGAWATRFGFATAGYVAVQQTPLQTVVRSSHTVVGMLVFMTAVIHAVRVFRLSTLTTREVVRPKLQEATDLRSLEGSVA